MTAPDTEVRFNDLGWAEVIGANYIELGASVHGGGVTLYRIDHDRNVMERIAWGVVDKDALVTLNHRPLTRDRLALWELLCTMLDAVERPIVAAVEKKVDDASRTLFDQMTEAMRQWVRYE